MASIFAVLFVRGQIALDSESTAMIMSIERVLSNSVKSYLDSDVVGAYKLCLKHGRYYNVNAATEIF